MDEKSVYRPPDVGAAWYHARTAASYRYRPAYPPQTFDILAALIPEDASSALDLGCGTGFITRPLAPRVGRVDAVDLSAHMIAEARRLPGGDHPGITWIVGRAEDVVLRGPYGLVTAGDSLHWMEWGTVLPRASDVLSPNGVFAVLSADATIVPEDENLEAAIAELIRRYSTYRPPGIRLLDELTKRGLFREEGRTETEPVPWSQSVDEYVESFHARASLAWGRMAPEAAEAFDTSLTTLLVERAGATVEQTVRGFVAWGKPLRP